MTAFPAGSGEMATLVRAHDWSATPLGPIDGWSPSLRFATNLLLATPVPAVMLWGASGVMIYNDGYSIFAGERHPSLLGSDVLDGWAEVADFNANVMKVGLGGGTLSYRGQMLELNRRGILEKAWLDLDYSPVFGDDGKPAGVIAIVVDVTAQRRTQDRTDALHTLSDRLRDSEDDTEIAFAAGEVIGELYDASRVGYGTITAESDMLHIERDWAAAGLEPFRGDIPMSGTGAFIDSLRAGETLVVNDVRKDPRTASFLDSLEEKGIRSLINVPIVEGGKLVALLFLNAAEARNWTPEDIALIRDVADRTRTAVDRARGRTELRDTVVMLRFLDGLTRAVAGTRDADTALAIITHMTGEHLGISNCSYGEMDDDEDGFTIFDDWCAPGFASIAGHYRLSDFGATAADLLRTGKPLVVSDNRRDQADADPRYFQKINVTASLCMPLIKDGQLTALMAVHDSAPHKWTSYDRAVLREVTERSWVYIERIRAEAELRRSAAALTELADTLEQRVVERTAQLVETEEALRQSQKMEAVGQLTGGLAHDFNNLLTGISGSLEMMQARVSQGRINELDRYFNAANGAVKRAAALTHRLLAFSRRQTLDPKATNVNRLVHDLEELVRRTVGPSVSVEVVGSAGLWPTLVDPNQLENALLNLCINARDAMPDGGRLTIETANRWLDERTAKEQDLPPGQYVSLCVTDTGTGMSPDVIAKAFDPFFTTKPLGVGTGLGLSMIYGFARQSGGQVRIYSELGQGTTMCIYLPRHDADPDAEDIAPARNRDPAWRWRGRDGDRR